ncbi:hypothetical protein PAERUG_P56_London_12_VIM_2_07_13_05246 [Pseudomonas aeruginosa]|nr:hypothetical protein PAERUG_P38_London_12_VIM_2_08_12_05403 [Pseudomonas aeruginosa]CRP48105.1 hypothetical protein PAERUG_P29_London_12_VIM_2_05_11_05302 [Pseudomonas aeruginosa]CRP88848.1 hypothetical protein PAERUG_P25_London_12_VIM_2_08_10_05222 [Pseudomonas aeruginosa]CRQ58081.1 hypothetical protein PAERUG_P47_London_12_VIM_2_12_12_01584 [Pseudomonas aeruginosa]CRR96847.1 hypothetical protein PAERUG_P56_London_12_VIM_2_07_13_05246 [Pseudomonas aeruginosa]
MHTVRLRLKLGMLNDVFMFCVKLQNCVERTALLNFVKL